MGKRKITIKQSVADCIAEVAWFIESKGMVASAEQFSDSVYDFFEQMADDRRRFRLCRDPENAAMGYKCVVYKRKYTIVIIESVSEIIICKFIPSKNIRW